MCLFNKTLIDNPVFSVCMPLFLTRHGVKPVNTVEGDCAGSRIGKDFEARLISTIDLV